MTRTYLAASLQQRKDIIERALEARLPAAEQPPVNVHLAMRYATLGAGKRLRPHLALAVADVSGRPHSTVLDAACAIEFIHAASLIVDDLPAMDNASTRRDKPCTHHEFGEATAILAAVGLIALAYDLVARNAAQIRPEACSTAVTQLSRAIGTGGLIYGQDADLRIASPPEGSSYADLYARHKAAALFLLSVTLPATILGQPREHCEALERFAGHMGLAFQITDDLLDAKKTGEDRGKDNLVSRMGPEEARRRTLEMIDEATRALAPFGPRAGLLYELAEYVKARIE